MADAEPVKVDAPPPPKQSIWTRKFGPLPGWGWAAVAAVGAAGYMWYRNRSSSSSTTGTGTSSTTGSQTSTGTGGTDYAPQLATLGAEIQQLQGAESTDTASSSTGTTPTGTTATSTPSAPTPSPRHTTGHAARHPATPKHHKHHKRKTREVTVRRGDTLSGIARRHHMSLRKLEKANPQIKNPNLIYPGEKVKL